MSSPMHVVVIGAGLGGLSSAAYLSRSGHNVTLLERDENIPQLAEVLDEVNMIRDLQCRHGAMARTRLSA